MIAHRGHVECGPCDVRQSTSLEGKTFWLELPASVVLLKTYMANVLKNTVDPHSSKDWHLYQMKISCYIQAETIYKIIYCRNNICAIVVLFTNQSMYFTVVDTSFVGSASRTKKAIRINRLRISAQSFHALLLAVCGQRQVDA